MEKIAAKSLLYHIQFTSVDLIHLLSSL